MSRWKAAGIHLLISLALVGCVLVILLCTWYPPAIMGISKADKLIYLLAGVDVVIGPLLTLLVYKTGKPSLKFDLSVIAVLQAAALAYGLYIVWQSRPVFMVGLTDSFHLVYANEIDPNDLAQAKDERYKKLGHGAAPLVGASMPINLGSQNIFAAIAGLQTKPRFFVSYDKVANELIEQALPVNGNDETPATVGNAIKTWAKSNKKDIRNLRYLPILSSRGNGVMIMDTSTKRPLAPLHVNPWGETDNEH